MSKPVPIYRRSSRPCSPACALPYAPRCLGSLPVHGVSTTRVTTPKLPSKQPASGDADPAHPDLPPGTPHMRSAHLAARVTVGTMANVHPASGADGVGTRWPPAWVTVLSSQSINRFCVRSARRVQPGEVGEGRPSSAGHGQCSETGATLEEWAGHLL